MSQQPEIVPQGTVAEKYQPPVNRKGASYNRIELALLCLVLLFFVFVLVVLVFGSMGAIDNANKYIPVAPTVAK